jgi:hypothetical protein
MIFISPQILRPPPPVASKPPRLNPVDEGIIAVLRDAGRYGLKVWALLDEVAASQNPVSRSERRSLRLEAWSRLRHLLRAEVVHRFGRPYVSFCKLPRLSVRRARRSRRGSTFKPNPSPEQQASINSFSVSLSKKVQAPPVPSGFGLKTQSAKTTSAPRRPDPVDLRTAAESLARLPRGVKGKLSGFVHGVRIRRDQAVLLPDGTLAFALGARRGKLVFFRDIPHVMEPGRWGLVDASTVTLLKNNAAVMLGRRKLGVREIKSEAKARAARLNGLRPCRDGKRRGRPSSQKAANSVAMPQAQSQSSKAGLSLSLARMSAGGQNRPL